MRFVIVYSKKDIAGKNIAEQLKKFYLPQIPILQLNKETTYSESIDKNKKLQNIDFIVFASRHASKEPRKTLSLHAPGNWRGADFGGKPGKVCNTSAFVLKYLFQELNKNAKELTDYECTLECTHHGPLIEIPCCFIELGSSEEQWQDKKAALVIAKTIASLQDYEKQKYKTAIGIGGPHYCNNFNKIQLNSEFAISHIIPEYTLPLTEAMLKEAIEKTQEIVQVVILDWKGLGKSEERQKILEIIKKFGINFKRTSEVEKETILSN